MVALTPPQKALGERLSDATVAEKSVLKWIDILAKTGIDRSEIIASLLAGAASLARQEPQPEEWALAFEKAADLARGGLYDGD